MSRKHVSVQHFLMSMLPTLKIVINAMGYFVVWEMSVYDVQDVQDCSFH